MNVTAIRAGRAGYTFCVWSSAGEVLVLLWYLYEYESTDTAVVLIWYDGNIISGTVNIQPVSIQITRWSFWMIECVLVGDTENGITFLGFRLGNFCRIFNNIHWFLTFGKFCLSHGSMIRVSNASEWISFALLVSRSDLAPTVFNVIQEVPEKKGDCHDLRSSI